jgi:rhodanese-related sulfurtransferase
MTYAGDKSVEDTWRALREDSSAVLVDVRTRAEWNFVGVPDLREAGKELVTVEWQGFPDSTRNEGFVDEVQQQVRPDQAVYLLCRSGGRSRAAAIALTAAGFARCYNVAGGFEGDLDGQKHRGASGGWKAAGLPWIQF